MPPGFFNQLTNAKQKDHGLNYFKLSFKTENHIFILSSENPDQSLSLSTLNIYFTTCEKGDHILHAQVDVFIIPHYTPSGLVAFLWRIICWTLLLPDEYNNLHIALKVSSVECGIWKILFVPLIQPYLPAHFYKILSSLIDKVYISCTPRWFIFLRHSLRSHTVLIRGKNIPSQPFHVSLSFIHRIDLWREIQSIPWKHFTVFIHV